MFYHSAEWDGGEVIGEKVWFNSLKYMLTYELHMCTNIYVCLFVLVLLKIFFTWQAASPWLYVVPWGIRKVLNYIAQRYNSPPIYVTENGKALENIPIKSKTGLVTFVLYMQNLLK